MRRMAEPRHSKLLDFCVVTVTLEYLDLGNKKSRPAWMSRDSIILLLQNH